MRRLKPYFYYKCKYTFRIDFDDLKYVDEKLLPIHLAIPKQKIF